MNSKSKLSRLSQAYRRSRMSDADAAFVYENKLLQLEYQDKKAKERKTIKYIRNSKMRSVLQIMSIEQLSLKRVVLKKDIDSIIAAYKEKAAEVSSRMYGYNNSTIAQMYNQIATEFEQVNTTPCLMVAETKARREKFEQIIFSNVKNVVGKLLYTLITADTIPNELSPEDGEDFDHSPDAIMDFYSTSLKKFKEICDEYPSADGNEYEKLLLNLADFNSLLVVPSEAVADETV